MANPTLTPFPTPPLPEQDEVTFNRNAANSLLAQANFVGEANIVVTWMGQQVDAVATNSTSALKSSKDAATSATGASGSADAAANSASQAQTYAAAAGAAAGAPSISGKADYMYSVNAAGNGTEWRVAPKRPTVATAGQAVVVNAAGNGFDTQTIPVSPITKYAESAQLSISAGGTASFAHGLGVVPRIVQAHYICTSAVLNYSVGDRIEAPISSAFVASNSAGMSIVTTASSITIRFASNTPVLLLDKSSGGGASGSFETYFKLVIRAAA